MNTKKILSLKFVLIVPFVFLMLAVSVLILTLSLKNTWRVSDTLISRMGDEIANEVMVKLEHLMQTPVTLNHVNYNAIKSGSLDINNRDERDRFFARQMEAFPEISYSYFGRPDSTFFGARRNETNAIEVILNNKETKNSSLYFSVDDQMNRKDLKVEIKNFDCRTRPWYQAAEITKKPIFSSIYRHFVYKDLAVTASHPVYDRQGNLLGVLGVDYRLDRINTYLQSMKVSPNSKILIVERKTGELVGNSMRMQNYIQEEDKLKRLRIFDFGNEEVKELEEKIISYGPLAAVDRMRLKEKISTGVYHIALSNFQYLNLDWQIMIFTPESEFSETMADHIRRSILLCFLVTLIATAIGLMIVRRVSGPIDQLVNASVAISRGDWGYQSPKTPYRELDHLSQSFNIMANQLRISISHLEEIVQVRTYELEEKNKELSKSNATKDQLFKIVAHDLRGPVGSIAALLQELGNHACGRLDCQLVNRIDQVSKGSQHVYELLNNLLTWAIGQSGEISLKPSMNDIDLFIVDTIKALSAQAELKEVELVYEPKSQNAYCDREMMQTVYRNLLSNAIKFTPSKGKITTEVRTDDRFVYISVLDTGVGMSEEHRKKVFTIGNGGLKQRGTAGENGTGLGLLLCKDFVEINGGTIEVNSGEEGGTRFTFTIPLADAVVS